MSEENIPVRVIFRKWKPKYAGIGDNVLAMFPDLKEFSGYVTSYEHIGQHGAADYASCIAHTRPAKPSEYKDLKKELETIGYRLIVRKHR